MILVPVGYRIFASKAERHEMASIRKSFRFMDNGKKTNE
jgi:hypothetical protein